MSSNKIRLSSNLTFLYKYIIPVGIIIGIFIFNVFEISDIGLIISVNITFVIMIVIFLYQNWDIKKVYYNKKKLYVSNYKKTEEFLLKNVIQITRWMFFYYIISIESENGIKRIKYLSQANENFFTPWTRHESVKKFEKRIKKEK